MKIGCVILAGGKSSRMGMDKALLEIGEKTFLEQIMGELDWFEEKFIARGVNGGGLAGNTETGKERSGWKTIPDRYPDHGPIGGIHAALAQCESDALFVLTCDMPLIKQSMAEGFCRTMEEDKVCEYDAVIAVEESGKVHPLCGVYRRAIVSVIEKQLVKDNNRMMALLETLRVKYVTLDKPQEEKQLMNINTPKEYKTLIKLKNRMDKELKIY